MWHVNFYAGFRHWLTRDSVPDYVTRFAGRCRNSNVSTNLFAFSATDYLYCYCCGLKTRMSATLFVPANGNPNANQNALFCSRVNIKLKLYVKYTGGNNTIEQHFENCLIVKRSEKYKILSNKCSPSVAFV